MPGRKTQYVRFEVKFVIKLGHLEPFDGTPIGPPDINGFIAAGMKTLLKPEAIEKAYIVGGSRFGMYPHFYRAGEEPDEEGNESAPKKKDPQKAAKRAVKKEIKRKKS